MSTVIDGSASVTINSGAVLGITSSTAVTCAGQTSIDFAGLPAWVKRITVMLNGVSLSGSSNFLFQLGAGSTAISGYSSSGSYNGATNSATTSTSGFVTVGIGNASLNTSGQIVFSTMGSNIWVGSGVFGGSGQSFVIFSVGSITLSGTLDRVRITTTNGIDTFDTTPSAGSINIMYEG